MPREKPTFRDNLERLDQRFPNKELLSIKDVISFTGMCYRTVISRFDFQDRYISKANLARALS